MTLAEFFNPRDVQHVLAYHYASIHGHWSQEFVDTLPDDIEFHFNDMIIIVAKLANQYVANVVASQQ